jgi:hypothetical protein
MIDFSQINWQNVPGWLAFILIIMDRTMPILSRFGDKIIPAKIKQREGELQNEIDQRRHENVMEQKKLDAELQYKKQVADAVTAIEGYIATNNERLSHVENNTKETRADVMEIKTHLMKRRKTDKAVKTRKGD